MFIQNAVNVADAIIPILIAILVVAIPVGVVVAIVLAIIASNETEKINKERTILLMIVSLIVPIILLFITISLWGLLKILSKTFT